MCEDAMTIEKNSSSMHSVENGKARIDLFLIIHILKDTLNCNKQRAVGERLVTLPIYILQ